MGLDMYLTAKHSFYPNHFGHGDTYRREDHPIAATIRGIDGLSPPPKSGNLDAVGVTFEAAYWRKANQIHNWFVDNVQEGKDECRPHYVSIEQLTELRDLCRKVLAASELEPAPIKNGDSITMEGDTIVRTPIIEDGQRIVDPIPASELLPTTSGFFFGGTEYDEWYYRDVEYTEKKLTELIEWEATTRNERGYSEWEFEYCSSW